MTDARNDHTFPRPGLTRDPHRDPVRARPPRGFRIRAQSVENCYSLGTRTAWLRSVMKTLAVRGMLRTLPKDRRRQP